METLILLLLAFIFPPAAVLVKRDLKFDEHLLINLVLTFLLCWIGGVAHAIYIILRD